MRSIHFYRLPNKSSPVEEYLDTLTGKQARKVLWVLRLIEELEVVPRQYLKKLFGTDELWEVRIQFGGNIFRLLGFFESGKLLILTSGFTKKTPKTPEREIELAGRRKKEYEARRK